MHQPAGSSQSSHRIACSNMQLAGSSYATAIAAYVFLGAHQVRKVKNPASWLKPANVSAAVLVYGILLLPSPPRRPPPLTSSPRRPPPHSLNLPLPPPSPRPPSLPPPSSSSCSISFSFHIRFIRSPVFFHMIQFLLILALPLF